MISPDAAVAVSTGVGLAVAGILGAFAQRPTYVTSLACMSTYETQSTRHLRHRLPLVRPTSRLILAMLAGLGSGASAADAAAASQEALCPEDAGDDERKSPLVMVLRMLMFSVASACAGAMLRGRCGSGPGKQSGKGCINGEIVVSGASRDAMPRTTTAAAQTDLTCFRDVPPQAPCSCTAVRGANKPRFLPLPEHAHG